MVNKKVLFALLLMMVITPLATHALEMRISTTEDIASLKQDFLDGKIKIGSTRLSEIRATYGDAPNITDSDLKLTYDYGTLKIDFDKRKVWKEWAYDGFKKPVYTDKVNDLRFDLESKELVGENITFEKVRRAYGEPTESFEKTEDGEMSIYYYGDIKMIFENVFIVHIWRGSGLDKAVEPSLSTK